MVSALAGWFGRQDQAAKAGSLMMGSSLNGAIVSRVYVAGPLHGRFIVLLQ